MLKTNYHTHCHYCDGSGTPEDYLREAAARNIVAVGFSSHAPVSFHTGWTMEQDDLPVYLRDVRNARAEGVQVYLGLEIDYVRNIGGPDDFTEFGLDYRIGAVHMLRNIDDGRHLSVDGPDEEFLTLYNRTFSGDIRPMVKEYYTLLCEMMEHHGFDFLAHFDLIKKKNRDNRYFDEADPWYRDAALEALALAGEKRIPLEINSGGISRGAIDEVYPSAWLLEKARRLSIPIVINADAHKPEHLDFHFEESVELCRRAGYREARVLIDGVWRDEGINLS